MLVLFSLGPMDHSSSVAVPISFLGPIVFSLKVFSLLLLHQAA
jgi:hypothetical protein